MSTIEQIRRIHAEEQRLQPRPVVATDIPISFEVMNTEWLTNVLCQDAPGAKVTSVKLGPVDNGSSNRRKIEVTYNDVGQRAGLTTKLFCKASHEIANRVTLGLSGSLLGETTFYNKVRPLIDVVAPEGVFATYDPDSFNSILMLKDISAEVESFCNYDTPMNQARVESQMELLAKVHARFLESAELKKIGRAVQQECRDRSRMPSSA
eukprot:TRINITY_DN96817_c0_g1_i1.p2 TRINITY_DN96817_c0_g1~~TRINITY_DN96817_c0_g1_i1.p2  ORF type:complete len:208 (+),score=58.94 TRINITY_DN96817_c0_g1_i1:233-856(+)